MRALWQCGRATRILHLSGSCLGVEEPFSEIGYQVVLDELLPPPLWNPSLSVVGTCDLATDRCCRIGVLP